MFEALFGPEMPVAARFFLAFLVVLALIGGAAYLVRRFGVDRLGTSTARGRQPRLAVIDATAVDSRRRLVLIRRDNIEHLLLIGGPTDVVVEPNIVRAAPVASARDAQLAAQPARNAPAIEPPPRAAAQHAAAQHVDNTLWPLQPEPAPRTARAAHTEEWPLVAPSEPSPREPSPREPSPRTIADPLAGLAMDLSRSIPLDAGSERPTPAERPTPVERPAIVERHPPAERPPPVERHATAERQPQDRQQERQKPEPEPMRAVQPQPAAAPELTAADQNLAEMAQRLEAALRRPIAASGGERPVVKPAAKAGPAPEPKNRSDNRSEQRAESRADNRPEARPAVVSSEFTAPAGGREPARPAPANRSAPPPEPPRPTPPEPKPAAKDAKPVHAKAVYDSLEQEMASLLGRPSEKS